MKKFMDENFLLDNPTAIKLYNQFSKDLPIIDYHCHISPKEIYEDVKFDNITQVWLGQDHYKWRQMRWNGVDEKFVMGDGCPREKFQKWTETLEVAIGNPLYHWSHLELKRYFGYEGILNSETAQEVWDICNAKLKEEHMSARGLIKQSNVEVICTTDDPIDSLEWHQMIKEDSTFDVQVLPTWRPDKVINIEKSDFIDYISKLSSVSHITINSFASLCEALEKRLDFFVACGCKITDHGLDYVMYQPCTKQEVESIFETRLKGVDLKKEEILKYKTMVLLFLGKAYHARNMTMQLHYGVRRDLNKRIFNRFGPDAGIDSINDLSPAGQLAEFLNALSDQLPKTILYSLNPIDNTTIGTIIGCFQDSSCIGKIQHGSAWWFNDNKTGMIDQMTSLANVGLLGNFIGMLTDSRSFLSYTRHEYFRRILCNLIGTWVENGEYPADEKALKKIVQGISYYNAKRYFEF